MSIEDNVYEAIKAFDELPEPKRESIVAALEHETAAISLQDLATRIAKKTNCPKEIVLGLARGLAHLVPLVIGDELRRASFAEFMAHQVSVEATARPRVEAYLKRMLGCEQSLGLTAKAQRIIWGHGKVFKEAHTITQIRPLFFDNLQRPANTAVIVHELRVEYREDGREESICVALDLSQLTSLSSLLERAFEKEQNIRALPGFDFLSPTKEGI